MSEPLYEKKFKVGMGEVKVVEGIELILCGVEGSKVSTFIGQDDMNKIAKEAGLGELEVRFSVHLAK